MTGPLSNRLLSQATGELAADARSLDSLKREAQRDPRAAVKKAAQQFEALFMQMVLKSMREATPKSGLLDSPGQDMYTGMLDQQMATRIAQSGTGLAEVIERQLTRHLRTEPQAVHISRAAGSQAARSVPNPGAAERTSALELAPRRAALVYAEIGRTDRTEAAGAVDPQRRSAPSRVERPSEISAAPAAESIAPTAQRAFVWRHWDSALQASRLTGLPAQHVLAQAALESGWGKGEIRDASGLPSYNLFGIKATGGWQGRTVEVATTEYEGGVARSVVQRFRAYNNYSEAFRDWAQLLTGSPRYGEVLVRGRDAHGFAFGLQRAGYATDPRYGDKLVELIASVGKLAPSS